MALPEISTRGRGESSAIVRASREVLDTRLSRTLRLWEAVQGRPTVAPARLTGASTPPRSFAASWPLPVSHRTSSGVSGWRRTSLTTSWPPARRAGTSALPMRPEAPVTAILTLANLPAPEVANATTAGLARRMEGASEAQITLEHPVLQPRLDGGEEPGGI